MIKERDINGKKIRIGDLVAFWELGDLLEEDGVPIGGLGIVESEGCYFCFVGEEQNNAGHNFLCFDESDTVEILEHHSLKYWGLE